MDNCLSWNISGRRIIPTANGFYVRDCHIILADKIQNIWHYGIVIISPVTFVVFEFNYSEQIVIINFENVIEVIGKKINNSLEFIKC